MVIYANPITTITTVCYMNTITIHLHNCKQSTVSKFCLHVQCKYIKTNFLQQQINNYASELQQVTTETKHHLWPEMIITDIQNIGALSVWLAAAFCFIGRHWFISISAIASRYNLWILKLQSWLCFSFRTIYLELYTSLMPSGRTSQQTVNTH